MVGWLDGDLAFMSEQMTISINY